MNVCMRRLGAAAIASPAFLTSEGFARASEQTVANHLGNCADGFKVSGRGSRKTGLDHINAEKFELLGDTEFILRAHACARALFSVTKGCIENKKLVSCSCHCFSHKNC